MTPEERALAEHRRSDAEIARIQRGFWAAVLGTLWTCIELGILFLVAILSIGHR